MSQEDGMSQASGELGRCTELGKLVSQADGMTQIIGTSSGLHRWREWVTQMERVRQMVITQIPWVRQMMSQADRQSQANDELGRWRVRQMMGYIDRESQANGDVLRYHGLGK